MLPVVRATDFVENFWLYPSNIALATCLPWQIMQCAYQEYFTVRDRLGPDSELGEMASIDFLLWDFQGSPDVRPDTTPDSVAASGGKEALPCARMKFIFAHVHPARCTSSDNINEPILHNKCGHLHEINEVSFW